MKLKHTALWSGVVAAALLLTACGKSNSGSGSMSSSGMSSSTASTAPVPSRSVSSQSDTFSLWRTVQSAAFTHSIFCGVWIRSVSM